MPSPWLSDDSVPWEFDRLVSKNPIGGYHHMGTTRMHDSPRYGVVDSNCQVHGIANLHIAGSSVFPTSSSNHPTMTLVALSLRLAERLVEQVRLRRRAIVGQTVEKQAEPVA